MNDADDVQLPPSAEPPASEGTPAKPTPPAKWRARLTKWQWKAHWVAPNLIPPPHRRDAIDQAHSDAKASAESCIPPDVDLQATMLWGVELYGPSEIEALYASVARLGWVGVGARTTEDTAAESIRQQRENGAGGWLNIGHVLPEDTDAPRMFAKNVAPLPHGVASLSVRVFQITTSLTAVLIGFELGDELADRYATEANRPRKTFYRRSVHQHAIEWVAPEHQKDEAIRRVRAELRDMVGHWFARYLPGYFSGQARLAEFPTMELLTLQGALFEQHGRPHHAWKDWRRLIVNNAPHEVWTFDDVPSLQLALDRPHRGPRNLHFVAAVDTDAFPQEKLAGFGDRIPRAYGSYCDHVLDGILLHGSTIEYLRLHLQDLNQTRDGMKHARSGWKHVSRTLDVIGGFFDLSLGSSVVARELAKHSEDVAWYRHDCAKFWCPGWKPEDEMQWLHEGICKRVNSLATQLAGEEDALRAHFEQLSTVLSVRESIKAQKWMSKLTVLALVVAIASLVVAVQSSERASRWVEHFLGVNQAAPAVSPR